MYSIMGVTGQVGGQIAARLLSAGLRVRAIVRNPAKGEAWRTRGCDIALASTDDANALATAFADSDGVFVMMPPDYDPAPGFPRVHTFIANLLTALEVARPEKLVFLSTVGAHVERFNLLNNSGLVEQALRALPMPVTLLRAGWFMENSAWDVAAARGGLMRSHLQPLEHQIPMVATADIATLAAELIQEHWQGTRIAELEGPLRYSARDISSGFAKALGHEVRLEAVPRETLEAEFRGQGMKYPGPRIAMLDGFNEGWLDFEHGEFGVRKGTTTLDAVLTELIKRS